MLWIAHSGSNLFVIHWNLLPLTISSTLQNTSNILNEVSMINNYTRAVSCGIVRIDISLIIYIYPSLPPLQFFGIEEKLTYFTHEIRSSLPSERIFKIRSNKIISRTEHFQIPVVPEINFYKQTFTHTHEFKPQVTTSVK